MTGLVVMVLQVAVVVRRVDLYILGGTISAGGESVKWHFIRGFCNKYDNEESGQEQRRTGV